MGQKSVAFDMQGNIIGYYDSIDSPVPNGINSITITDSQWRMCLSTPGFTVKNDNLVALDPPTDAQILNNAKALKIASLSAACQAAIYAGFTSSALGALHSYPFQDKDQVNLTGDVMLSILPSAQASGWTVPFWCADSAGVWAMRPHTAVQIQQVGQDAAAMKLTMVSKNISFASQVEMAMTIPDVQAVTWS
jgi:hypothetical protein